jgi:hypothetical protein
VADHILEAFGAADPDPEQPPGPAWDMPVFVPAHPRYVRAEGPPVFAVELLEWAGTTPVPVAFSSLERLVTALGEAQPWMAVAVGPFSTAMVAAGLPKVRLDPAVPPGVATWRREDLEEYARKVTGA